MNLNFGWFKQAFLGGVFTGELKDRDNGGPECASDMTFQYRLIVTLCIVNTH